MYCSYSQVPGFMLSWICDSEFCKWCMWSFCRS